MSLSALCLVGILGLAFLTHEQGIPLHVATRPDHRLGEDWWKQRHERCVAQTKSGGFDIAFLGDSITQGWEDGGRTTWNQHFAALKSANFGFSGDRTEHVLWRLDNGEIVGANPKVIVIMIGTNNVGHGSSNAAQTSDGVRAIVGKLREKLPTAKILLLGVFPRGAAPDDRLRLAVNQATAGFASLHDGKHVFFSDIGKAFVRIDGSLRSTLMPDLLHLNPDGYAVWGKAIVEDIKRLLG